MSEGRKSRTRQRWVAGSLVGCLLLVAGLVTSLPAKAPPVADGRLDHGAEMAAARATLLELFRSMRVLDQTCQRPVGLANGAARELREGRGNVAQLQARATEARRVCAETHRQLSRLDAAPLLDARLVAGTRAALAECAQIHAYYLQKMDFHLASLPGTGAAGSRQLHPDPGIRASQARHRCLAGFGDMGRTLNMDVAQFIWPVWPN